MNEFVEKSRSNYFEVTELDDFKIICKNYGLKALYGDDGSRKGKVGFIISDRDKVRGESIHRFKGELVKILKPGEVCVVRTIAHEEGSIEEVHGRTIAINSEGEELLVDLDHIYTLVEKRWGVDVSPAEE